MKQNIYDEESFFKEYDGMRNSNKGVCANDVIEIPIFRKMMPDVKEKSILDLGCGYGENVKFFKEKGAKYVLGTDISKHMIEIANKENKTDGVEFKVIAMEDIEKIKEKFDVVVSSLAFHYIKDFEKLSKDIYEHLNNNGVLLFSQEHPMVTCLNFNSDVTHHHIQIGEKRYRLVADYNRNGIRENPWFGSKVQKYQRNFSTIINTLVKTGFVIDEINECEPNDEMIAKNPKYINQFDSPYFLFVKCHKEV